MTSNSSKAFCLAGLGLALMLGTTGASFAQEIVLGAVVPSSGPFAEWGRANTTTLQMLEKQVNSSGGINGAKLRIAILDDATKPAQATNNLRKLAGDDKVLAVAGPLTSGLEMKRDFAQGASTRMEAAAMLSRATVITTPPPCGPRCRACGRLRCRQSCNWWTDRLRCASNFITASEAVHDSVCSHCCARASTVQ